MSNKTNAERIVERLDAMPADEHRRGIAEARERLSERQEQQRRERARVAAERLRGITLLDTIECDSCGDETTDPSRCDHGEDLCPDCRDQGACSLCEREDATDYMAEMRADR